MKKPEETKKQNLLRRLEENREFFQATRKMAYASFMEELIEYIEETEILTPEEIFFRLPAVKEGISRNAKAMSDAIDEEILKGFLNEKSK